MFEGIHAPLPLLASWPLPLPPGNLASCVSLCVACRSRSLALALSLSLSPSLVSLCLSLCFFCGLGGRG